MARKVKRRLAADIRASFREAFDLAPGTDAGIRYGALVANPHFRPGGAEPLYMRR